MHSKTQTLRKHYDKLDPAERFRLALAAWERGDENEVKALGQSAPKETYRMTAYPYMGMWRGIEHAGWGVITDVMLYAFPMVLSDMMYLGDRGDNPLEYLEHAAMIAQRVLATWDGLALFCEELEITVPQALEHAPHSPVVDAALELAHNILEAEDGMMLMLAERYEGMEGKGLEELKAERVENTAQARAEEAREYADMLRQIWEAGLEGRL